MPNHYEFSPTKIKWRDGIQETLYVNSPISLHSPFDTSMSGSILVTSSGDMDIFANNDVRLRPTDDVHIFYGTETTAYATFDGVEKALVLHNQTKIAFDGDSTNTYIAANTDNPEDLEIHADQDIVLRPDADVRIKSGDDEYATFIGTGNKLELKNDLDGEYKPLTIWNQSNANDTTGKVSINYYLGDTSDNPVHAGKILVGKSLAFTDTSTTQNSFMEFHTSLGGTLASRMTLSPGGALSVTGDISAVNGSFTNMVSAGGDIILTNQSKIVFDSDATNTYIAANTDNPEDLEIHADHDIHLQPDADVRIFAGDDEYATFIGTGNKLELFNDAVDGDYQPLTLWNKNIAAGGKVSLNYFLGDNNDPSNGIHSGKILVSKEQLFTTTESTHNSSMEFHLSREGNLASKMSLSSAGVLATQSITAAAAIATANLNATNLLVVGGQATFNGQVGIGTSAPQHKLDVPSVGGLIYGTNYIHRRDSNGDMPLGTSLAILSSFAASGDSAHPTDISFVAPSNGLIKIRISFHLKHIDGESAHAEAFFGLYSNNNNGHTGYVTDIDGVSFNDMRVAVFDDFDNEDVVLEGYFKGLTAGNTYLWEIHGKSSHSGAHVVTTNKVHKAFIVEAISLPSSAVNNLNSTPATNWNAAGS